MFQIPSFDPTYVLPDAPAPETPPMPPLRKRRVDVPPEAPAVPQMALPPLVAMDPAQPEMPPVEPEATPNALPPLRPRLVPDMEVTESNPTHETRPRYIGDDRQRRIDNREKFINDPAYRDAPENHPGRLKSFATGALLSAGQAANDVLAGSRHSGQPVTWGDVGQIVAGGLGGGAAGAVKPKLIADLEHQSEIARLKGEQAEERVKRQQAIDEAAKRAAIGLDVAKAADLNNQNRPQAKERDQLIGIWKDLDEFSPESNPELAQRWQTAFGYPAPSKTKGDQTQIVTRPDGVYRINKKDGTVSRVDGIADDRVEMTIGGQKFRVTEAQAVNALALSGREGTAAANANAGFDADWEKNERERRQQYDSTTTEATGLTKEVETLGARNDEIANIMKAPHTRVYTEKGERFSETITPAEFADSPEGRQLQSEFAANKAKGAASQTKAAALNAKAQSLSEPTPRRRPNAAPPSGTVSRPTGPPVPRDTAKQRLIEAGYTEDEADAALKARGY